MIYELRNSNARPMVCGRLQTWDGVVTDAGPDSMALLIGYKIEDALDYLKDQQITWKVSEHPAQAPADRRASVAMMQG